MINAEKTGGHVASKREKESSLRLPYFPTLGQTVNFAPDPPPDGKN